MRKQSNNLGRIRYPVRKMSSLTSLTLSAVQDGMNSKHVCMNQRMNVIDKEMFLRRIICASEVCSLRLSAPDLLRG
jgi:hypothetical protein